MREWATDGPVRAYVCVFGYQFIIKCTPTWAVKKGACRVFARGPISCVCDADGERETEDKMLREVLITPIIVSGEWSENVENYVDGVVNLDLLYAPGSPTDTDTAKSALRGKILVIKQ
jgi:hypothetical protein